jgi:hypothetical protein
LGLVAIGQAAAQTQGDVNYASGSESLAPQAGPIAAEAATPNACPGGCGPACNACAQPCPACSGRGCGHCNGTGLFRGCDQCRKQLRDEHAGLFMHHGYWDGRHECEECPYGRDDVGRCCEPRWAVTAGAIAMRRSTARKSDVIRDASGTALVSMDTLNLDWSVGPRVDVIRRFEAFDIEFVYWGIDDWDQGRQALGDRSLSVPLVGTDAYSFAGAAYQSRLYNGEMNAKLRMAEAVNLILGFRAMELHEKFLVGAGTSASSGRQVDAIADNYLTGFQIGADTDAPIWAGISFNLYVKAGVFNNHNNQRTYTQTIANGQLTETGDSLRDDCVAFVGETGVIGTWQLNKNLGLYGGYQFMWIDGVTLAPDMLTSAPVRTNSPHYQGALFGATFQW